ncbi:hypothetical protein [Paenibacillus radicis (ex Xue et al. 2023)]|uniref:Uncharacterized protein n=1 Tax=Paenibacillus radicis (ex Xue et al. 2023) TaxID=2972489 RepID=A0ABT1YM69_9BACL|nr:hypothetical protein [Paenibacillus radicis (ex Xue et al. 2023)]MCR8633090.1 hypothetical protein [Paenibacillus radicis (ex Xue et al. 2023)]
MKWVTFLLEFIRFLIFFALGLMVLGELERVLYQSLGIQMGGSLWWMPGLANVLLMFIAYHNWLQFSGWFKSPVNRKLTKRTTLALVCIALLLLIFPFFI